MAKDLIFDIDGTLWDSTDGIAGAFNEILLEEPLVQPYYPLTAEDLKREFGKPLYDIGYSLFPAVPKEENNRIIDRMCDHEVAWLRSQPGLNWKHRGGLSPSKLNTIPASS